jgi:hypothetical protein
VFDCGRLELTPPHHDEPRAALHPTIPLLDLEPILFSAILHVILR